MIKFVVVVAFLALSVSATKVDKCTTNSPLPVDVKINDCAQGPCPLKRGSQVNADIKFTAPFDVEEAKASVRANALGTTTEYPLPDPDVCSKLTDNACPVTQGEDATYHLDFPIFNWIPTGPVTIQFTLSNSQGEIACFSIDCSVV